jgi:general secretion pathway protein L
MFAVAIVHFEWQRREQAIEQLGVLLRSEKESATALAADAAAVRAVVGNLAQLRQRKAAEPSAIDRWAEIARILPDNTWLTKLSISEQKVTLSGVSQSPGELLGLLEQSELFAAAIFTAPVTRDHLSGQDRFSIEMNTK